jgi:hypothetical protein
METIRSKISYIIFGSVIGSVIWEYVGKKTQSNIKPSVAITYVATKAGDLFYYIGQLAAKISSFYTYIDFKDFFESIHDLFKPMINLVISPFQFISGYINVSLLYKHPYIVGFGSLTLMLLISYICYRTGAWEYVRSLTQK